MLLWLWRRPAAVAPIQPLDWELPYAVGVALKSKIKKKKKFKLNITESETEKNKSDSSISDELRLEKIQRQRTTF